MQADSDPRLAALTRWVFDDLGFAGSHIAPASADASFRRYFRVTRGDDTFIVMDAPPDKEDVAPFLKVGSVLAGMGVNVPLMLARDVDNGFLFLTDLGTQQYLDEMKTDPASADRLYGDAMAALVVVQTADPDLSDDLPRYDEALLLREMELLPDWFLKKHLRIEPSDAERRLLDESFAALSRSALSQPATFVHRDYHSRNLLLAERNPGILDFQDAVWGPVTYDLVSLLKDAYIAWPRARVEAWVADYRRRLLTAGFDVDASETEFLAWFDLMGMQRHIKVLGIFARLFYRDGKAQYLRDLPRVLHYVREVCRRYEETADLAQFLERRVVPQFDAAQARALA